MLDVKKLFAVLCVFLLALQPLMNLQFFVHIMLLFSNQKVLFLAVNDAIASSPQEDTAIDS